MGAQELNYITPEEYLATERMALEKHEYFLGEIFAMSGASFAHNDIFSNAFSELSSQLKGKNCKPYGSDLRIHIPKNSLYTYPDMSVICGKIQAVDNKFDTAINPSVLFEILSPSTQNYDQIAKFELYRDIDSLQEYIMIRSDKVQVLKYVRNTDNSWLLTVYKSIDDIFSIDSLGVQLYLETIYDDVNFKL